MTPMKWTGLLALGLLAAAWGCSQQRPGNAVTQSAAGKAPSLSASGGSTAEASVLKTPKDATSYALGVQMARGMKRQGIEVDLDAWARGIKDAQAGKEPAEGAETRPAGAATASQAVPQPPKGKAGYGAGFAVARGLTMQGAEVDWDLMARGIKDVFAGDKLLLPDDFMEEVLEKFTADLLVQRRGKWNVLAMDNKKAGEDFLAANKAKDGVVTLPSGLQYKIVKAGDGPRPTRTDTVEINYRGTLIDGTEFVNTRTDGRPAVINLSDTMIAGLRDALKLMPVGSKWQVFIPANLGYLWRGWGRLVGPNATLIYEVELLGIR